MAKAIIIRVLGVLAFWFALQGISTWGESLFAANQAQVIPSFSPVHPHSHHGANKWNGNFLATEMEETQASEKKPTKSFSFEGYLITWLLRDFLPEQTHFEELADFNCANPARPLFLWQEVFRL